MARLGPLLGEPSAPAVGQILGFAFAAGVCAVEERRRTVPKEQPTKKDFTPFRAGSAAPDESGGCWDEGRIARLRDTAASAELF